MSQESITDLIGRVKAGDGQAAQELWEAYFLRLVRLAREKLRGTPRREQDEEDVALSVFDSFIRCAEQGRFPRLHDRRDLWQLLYAITRNKTIDAGRRARRRKEVGESALAAALSHQSEMPGIGQVADQEPSPEVAALLAGELRSLLDRLGNDKLASIAVWKMEGYTSAEIAARLGCVLRTVERKLSMIRRLWKSGWSAALSR